MRGAAKRLRGQVQNGQSRMFGSQASRTAGFAQSSEQIALFVERRVIRSWAMNRVALITGASRGIGRGIALELAKIGFDLAINFAGNLMAARATAEDCVAQAKGSGHRVRAEIFQADQGLAADRQKLVDSTRSTFHRLDLLVNNAGITSIGRADLLDATEENFDRLMAINLKGPYFLTQLAAKWMIEQSKTNRRDGGVAAGVVILERRAR